MRESVPEYDEFQDRIATATGTGATRILELGTGTGETARRVLTRHPQAVLIGLDASGEILHHARAQLPATRIDLRVGRLEDPLPEGPFDVVVSALTVHHLDGPGKAALFRRIADALRPRGRFVLGDFVVGDDITDPLAHFDPEYDKPSTLAEQVRWLEEAELRPHVNWTQRELAIVTADAA
jgi:tRNA (cmo5U34)-methyltransferase